jgi:hypothetical protein
MNVKKKATVELMNESEKASLYSISFEMDGTTEFEMKAFRHRGYHN